MADHTQTIVNTLTPLGIGVVNNWNEMDWNDHWGSNADAYQDVGKGLDMANLNFATDVHGVDVVMITGGNTITPADAVGKDVTLTRNDGITFSEDLSAIIKRLGDWEYIFTQPDKNGRFKLTDTWGDPI